MISLEENVVYEKLPTCPDERVTNFYMYKRGMLYCRSRPDRVWHPSMFRIPEIIPHLNIIPEYLRVSEGL